MRKRRFLAMTGYASRRLADMMPIDFADQWQRQTGIALGESAGGPTGHQSTTDEKQNRASVRTC